MINEVLFMLTLAILYPIYTIGHMRGKEDGKRVGEFDRDMKLRSRNLEISRLGNIIKHLKRKN